MKNCTDCKYANWQRTDAGKLHPSGAGRCTAEYKLPPPPASMYWLVPPYLRGGNINRRRALDEDCTYFERRRETVAVPAKNGRESASN